MIPDHPPSREHSTESEQDFWRELKQQLSDDFYVYHGLPYLRDDGRQGEVDFLVVHRTHGMLNIECKGGGVNRDENGDWFRTKPNGRTEKLRRSPTEQARAQLEAIVNGLVDPLRHKLDVSFSKFPVVYGWALAFPYTRSDDLNLPMSLKSEVVIDSRHVYGDLEAAVVEAVEFHGRKLRRTRSLDQEQFKKFRSVISPPMSIPPKVLAAALDRERRDILRLSERQATMIRQMLANRRLRVPGGAGTGKTVLAIHGAKTLADRGEDVLLTCFNADLGDHLQNAIERWDGFAGNIDVHHFHELCAMADQELGGVLDYPSRDASREEKSRFWREETAFALLQALDEGKLSIGPWDAIIVDEGQDFAANWWQVLREGLRDQEKGRMVVFHDDEQAIFDREPSVPEMDAQFPLFENFRNTVAIAEKVQRLADLELQPHVDAPEGQPPKIFQQPGPAKTRRMLTDLLDKLVDRERLDYRQIAILTPHSPRNSALEGATELGEHPVVHDLEDWSDGVLHSSIGSFKGLEADVVILVDIDPDDERCSRNDRYVAASRAVHRLFIFEKSHWLADVE